MSDPKEVLEEKCAQTEKCRPLLEAYQRCVARVEGRGEVNTETCVEELFDLQPCIDNCVTHFHIYITSFLRYYISFKVAKHLFKKLK